MINFDIQKERFLKLRSFVLDLMFPIECVRCGTEGEWLCYECSNFINKSKKGCFFCGKHDEQYKVCRKCKDNKHIDAIISYYSYKSPHIKKLIKNFKYYFAKDISKLISINLVELIKNIPDYNKIISDSVMMPIPLHKKRLKWRGFNQAELISNDLSKQLGIEHDVKTLIRKKHAKVQAKVEVHERFNNIKNVFELSRKNLPKKIILVDDIATSGATLDECAKLLKENGVEKVYGVVFAKG